MANPSSAWNTVPVFAFYFKGDDVTPESGRVTFSISDRISRVDGRRIYPAGASVTRNIGDTSSDPVTRDAVRAAWRAADQAAQGASFDGAAWDAWWNVMLTGAVFASFPASDDPDIVQTGYQVKVEEGLSSGSGKTYYIQPLLAHLGNVPPGINLGLVDVPPGSPSTPAPIYAKGMAGGVASLGADGLVPVGQLPAGIGGGTTVRVDGQPVTTFDVSSTPVTAETLGVFGMAIHGSNAAYARPTTSRPVIWFGTVQPTALADGDVYVPVTTTT